MELLKEANIMTVFYGLCKIYEKWATRCKKKGILPFIDPEVLPFISPIHFNAR
jgi:fructose-bisphosphate aldolase class 1